MEKKRQKQTGQIFRRLRENKAAMFGFAILVVLILCALLADVVAPNDPNPSPPDLANK